MKNETPSVKEVFSEDMDREVEVRGQSMRFLIADGEMVIVQRIKPQQLTVGDILLFYQDNQFFVHRIVYKRQNNGQYIFITKGDMHLGFDPPVGEEQILGKVITIKKRPGSIGLAAPAGKILSYSICAYSTLAYLGNVAFDVIVNHFFDALSKILSLLHRTNSQFLSTFLPFSSRFDKNLNQAAGSVYRISCQGKRRADFLLSLLELIPTFFFTIFVYCFQSFPEKEHS